jgi:hypothetical protein
MATKRKLLALKRRMHNFRNVNPDGFADLGRSHTVIPILDPGRNTSFPRLHV